MLSAGICEVDVRDVELEGGGSPAGGWAGVCEPPTSDQARREQKLRDEASCVEEHIKHRRRSLWHCRHLARRDTPREPRIRTTICRLIAGLVVADMIWAPKKRRSSTACSPSSTFHRASATLSFHRLSHGSGRGDPPAPRTCTRGRVWFAPRSDGCGWGRGARRARLPRNRGQGARRFRSRARAPHPSRRCWGVRPAVERARAESLVR